MNQAALVATGPELIKLGYKLTVATGEKGNRPFLPRWQQTPIPAEQWERFATMEQTTGMGIITAGLAVIDIDGAEGLANWIEFLRVNNIEPAPFRTQMVATPGGGFHLYLRDQYQQVTNAGGVLGPIPKIDVRGTGGFIATPPTQRAGTAGYQWLSGPFDIGHLPVAPGWLGGKLRRRNDGALVLDSPNSGDWKPEVSDWGKRGVQALALRLVQATAGDSQAGRHQVLIEGAVAAGHLIVEGCMTLGFAYGILNDAARMAGLHGEGREDEVRRTILSGFLYAFAKRSAGIGTLIEAVEGQQ